MFIFIFTSALSIENYLNNGLFITQTKHDRSPLILDDVSKGIWLSDDNPEDIHVNISHDFGHIIENYQVTRSVNNPKNNNASLIEEFNEVPF